MRNVYFIILLLWIAGMTYWSNKTFCSTPKAKPSATSAVGAASSNCDRTLNLKDGGEFNASSTSNFAFQKGTATFYQPSEVLIASLSKVAMRLNEMSNKTILVEGLYTKDENESIGQARAVAIKKYLVAKHQINEDQIRLGAEQIPACYTKNKKGEIRLNKGTAITFGEK